MRALAAAAVMLWFAPLAAVILHVFGVPLVASFGIGGIAVAPLAWWIAPPLAETFAPGLRPPVLAAIAAAAATLAIAEHARMSVFMADPSRNDCSYTRDAWRRQHSCLTAYAEAVRFARAGDTNIYDMTVYEPRFERGIRVDSYHYPPVFLLLPGAIYAVRPALFDVLALWFVMQSAALVGCLFGLTRWIGGRPGALAAIGGLLALASPQVLYALQQGNIQPTAFTLATVGLACLLSGRLRLGAPLLAFFAAAKIFPAALVVYLIAARRWRALTWLAASGVLLLALTIALFGTRPLVDFVNYEMPRISNGEAFPQAERPDAAKTNLSMYGVTTRLRFLGVSALDRSRGLAIASLYGLGVIALAALTGWRHRPDLSSPAGRLHVIQIAVAILSLASFRSPFVGAYGFVATIWLLSLVAADASTRRAAIGWWGAGAAFVIAHWLIPAVGQPPTPSLLIGSGALVILAMGLDLLVIARAWSPELSGATRAVGVPA